MKDENPKKSVSSKKLEANRRNAQRSTGPRTTKGKLRASENSYKHGFFSHRLFPTKELGERDGADYRRLFTIYWNHYEPLGDVEKLCVETIAFDSLRLARFLGHEQVVLDWRAPFESRSIDRLTRYEASLRRQLARDIEHLESLQEKSRSESDELESEPEFCEDASNPYEVTEPVTETSEVFVAEAPNGNGASEQGSTPTGGARSVSAACDNAGNGISNDDGALKSSTTSLVAAIDDRLIEETENRVESQDDTSVVSQ